MPVETIECQIVQAQLGRYLTGDHVSPEAIAEIEAHVASCSICRMEVAKRRTALQTLLGGAVAPSPQPSANALIEALREKAPSTKTETTRAVVEQMETSPSSLSPRKLARPLIYGSALAVVLIAMSYLGNNPTTLFGQRAAETQATVAKPETQPTAADSVTTFNEAAAEIVQPVDSTEWDALGLADHIPFDVELASSGEPWEWYDLGAALEVAKAPVDETPVATPAPTKPTLKAPEPAAADKASTSPAQATPKRSAAKRIIRPRPKHPANTIRVYEPGS